MSNQVFKVSVQDYLDLYSFAVDLHKDSGDPIPKMNSKTIKTVNYILDIPFQSNFGKSAYVGFYKKASILFYLMIKNHPLENGNKRLACMVLGLFYEKNNRFFKITNSKLYDLSTFVAKMDSLTMPKNIDEIVKTLKKYE